MFKFKIFKIIIHIAGWMLFLSFPLTFISKGQNSNIMEIFFTQPYLLFSGFFIALFYLNAYLLMPKLFFKKKYYVYSIIVIVLLNVVYFLRPFDQLMHYKMQKDMENYVKFLDSIPQTQHSTFPPPENFRDPDFNIRRMPPPPNFRSGQMNQKHRQTDFASLFTFFLIMAFSTAYKLMAEWQLSEQRALSAETEKANAELSFLKAQINPHFLFNTLNNIYSLSVSNDPNASESIMKLSNIMRYITDEAEGDWVSLSQEIEFITDYIDLQRLRIGDKTEVIFRVNGQINEQKISPLIFISFIENVFKYGISKITPSVIQIEFTISDEKIHFLCRNTIFKNTKPTERIGIGLTNTQKRLAYLYPNQQHQLHIDQNNHIFSVDLTINC